MGFMLSLSPCMDDGSDSAADAYANQLVAGDEQEPYDVLWSPGPVQIPHAHLVQSASVQMLRAGYLLAKFQVLS